jgi:hypothetical protein
VGRLYSSAFCDYVIINFSEFEEKLAMIILISGMSVLFVYLISKMIYSMVKISFCITMYIFCDNLELFQLTLVLYLFRHVSETTPHCKYRVPYFVIFTIKTFLQAGNVELLLTYGAEPFSRIL